MFNTPQPYSYLDPSFRSKFGEVVAQEPLNPGWHVAGLVWTPDQVNWHPIISKRVRNLQG